MQFFGSPQTPRFDQNNQIAWLISTFERQEAALDNLVSFGRFEIPKAAYFKKFKELKKYCKEHFVCLVALDHAAWGMLATELTSLTKRFENFRKALVVYLADLSPESASIAKMASGALRNELASLRIDPRRVCGDWLAISLEPPLNGGLEHVEGTSTNQIEPLQSKSGRRKPSSLHLKRSRRCGRQHQQRVSEDVKIVKNRSQGRVWVIVGGDPSADQSKNITKNFGLSELKWPKLIEHGPPAGIEPAISNSETLYVLICVKLTGHAHSSFAKKIAKKYNKKVIMLPGGAGLNPNSIAYQILHQDPNLHSATPNTRTQS